MKRLFLIVRFALTSVGGTAKQFTFSREFE
jgi:hypothetical protein